MDEYQENIGRIVAVGPLAGYDELSGDPDPANRTLPGWPWYEVGDIVLCSRMSSTRQRIENEKGRVNFRLIPYRDVMAKVVNVAQVLR
jgi:tRNA G37 N-methylase Trm5